MYICTIFGLFKQACYLLQIDKVTWEGADGGSPGNDEGGRRGEKGLEPQRRREGRDDNEENGTEGEDYKYKEIEVCVLLYHAVT